MFLVITHAKAISSNNFFYNWIFYRCTIWKFMHVCLWQNIPTGSTTDVLRGVSTLLVSSLLGSLQLSLPSTWCMCEIAYLWLEICTWGNDWLPLLIGWTEHEKDWKREREEENEQNVRCIFCHPILSQMLLLVIVKIEHDCMGIEFRPIHGWPVEMCHRWTEHILSTGQQAVLHTTPVPKEMGQCVKTKTECRDY